jgi:hypothetical protein
MSASLTYNQPSVRNKCIEFDSLSSDGFSQPIARKLFSENASLQPTVPLSEASKNIVFRSMRQNRSVTPKKRPRVQVQTPVVESQVRRSTRQSVRNNGYKLEPMRDNPTPKKKQRSAKPVPEVAESRPEVEVTPHTPINVLQKVGQGLEIPASEITEEKLMACPDKKGKHVPND